MSRANETVRMYTDARMSYVKGYMTLHRCQ